MRVVNVSKDEFDDFLYPAIGNSSAENESDLETAIRVMKKIKDPKLTYEEDITTEQQEQAAKNRTKIFPFKRLRVDQANFEFEEDEHKLIVERLKKFIPRVTLLVAEELHGFIERVKKAEQERNATEVLTPKIER